MLFSAVFVTLVLIGSSVAEDDAERILGSLRHVHSQVSAYLEALSNIYNGFAQLKRKDVYTTFTKQDETIKEAAEVETPEQVIQAWTTDAINVIDECTRGADQYVRNEYSARRDVVVDVKSRIMEATGIAMQLINEDVNIIDEQKGDGCPIYDHLSNVMLKYGGKGVYQEFQRTYAIA